MDAEAKNRAYDELLGELGSLLEGIEDPVAVMASTVAVIHHKLPYASWTGFYRVVDHDLLRIGPYQGPVGCLEIAFETGVCGAAARQERTQVVADVHAFPGHIACDPTSRSEIVVPVRDSQGDLTAVLDVDSRQPAAFDSADQRGLELVAETLRAHL